MIEKFIPLAEAAEQLGMTYSKVQRAAKLGHFPTYTFQNARILVRLSEVIASIEASSTRVPPNADDPVGYLSPPRDVIAAAGDDK